METIQDIEALQELGTVPYRDFESFMSSSLLPPRDYPVCVALLTVTIFREDLNIDHVLSRKRIFEATNDKVSKAVCELKNTWKNCFITITSNKPML